MFNILYIFINISLSKFGNKICVMVGTTDALSSPNQMKIFRSNKFNTVNNENKECIQIYSLIQK